MKPINAPNNLNFVKYKTQFMKFLFIFIIAGFSIYSNASAQQSEVDSLPIFNGNFGTAHLGWKYHAGDDSTWKNPDFDDRQWYRLKNTFFKYDNMPPNWQNIGWFRFRFKVRNDVKNQVHELQIFHRGASEIYLDGRLLRKFGVVSKWEQQEMRFPLASYFITPIYLDSADEHLIAVRYSLTNSKEFREKFWKTQYDNKQLIIDKEGFDIHLKNRLIFYLDTEVRGARGIFGIYIQKGLMIGTFLSIGIVFLIIFLYNRHDKMTLWFSLFMFGMAFQECLEELIFSQAFNHTDNYMYIITIVYPVKFSTGISFVAFLYSVVYGYIPKRIWILIGLGLLMIISFLNYQSTTISSILGSTVILFLIIEMIRLIWVSFKKKHKEGRVILFFVSVLVVLILMLIGLSDLLMKVGLSRFVFNTLLFGVTFFPIFAIVIITAIRNAQNIKNLALQLT